MSLRLRRQNLNELGYIRGNETKFDCAFEHGRSRNSVSRAVVICDVDAAILAMREDKIWPNRLSSGLVNHSQQ